MRKCRTILSIIASLAMTSYASAADVLAAGGTIELPSVKGRIDHFGIDAKRQRLFVAALGNDTVEVVDVRGRRRERSLPGFGEPQGILYVPGVDRVFVANGSADRVDILDAGSLARVKSIAGMADADNVRYDAGANRVWVGYGKGALRALDPQSGESAADIALPGHPESFQLETRGPRIFVNVPTTRQVAVVDRAKAAVTARWAVPDARQNFPMALDEAGRRLFVGARRPAVLLVYDIDSGRVVARVPVGEDADDLFFDAARERVYVICGGGRVDVLRRDGPDRYVREGGVRTAPRARTGFFVADEATLYVAAPASGGAPARLLAYRAR
jgi:DNA-binding beta-propeller fold protein YncE